MTHSWVIGSKLPKSQVRVSDELVLAALEVVRAAAEGVGVEAVLAVRAAGVLTLAARGRGSVEELASDGHGVKDGARRDTRRNQRTPRPGTRRKSRICNRGSIFLAFRQDGR